MAAWHSEALKIPECVEGNEKEKIVGIDREAAILLTHTSCPTSFAVRADWFEEFIGSLFGII